MGSAASIDPRGEGWRFCLTHEGEGGAVCAPVYFGRPAAVVDGEWNEVLVTVDRLRINLARPGFSFPLFDGLRDGCD